MKTGIQLNGARIRQWLLLGLVGLGLAIVVVNWPRRLAAKRVSLAATAAPAAALRASIMPLADDPGSIYIENPDALLYFYISYYAYPRRVCITDKNVPVNTNQDILDKARPATPEICRKLNVSCVVRNGKDGLALFKLR